jgi:hypothetical protein
MEWKQIRDHYRRAFGVARRQGLTQVGVARAGGIKGQNQISKLLNSKDTARGMSVVQFLKALDGIGLSASAFFADLEQRHAEPGRPILTFPTPGPTSEADLERAIGRLVLDAIRLAINRPKP